VGTCLEKGSCSGARPLSQEKVSHWGGGPTLALNFQSESCKGKRGKKDHYHAKVEKGGWGEAGSGGSPLAAGWGNGASCFTTLVIGEVQGGGGGGGRCGDVTKYLRRGGH